MPPGTQSARIQLPAARGAVCRLKGTNLAWRVAALNGARATVDENTFSCKFTQAIIVLFQTECHAG